MSSHSSIDQLTNEQFMSRVLTNQVLETPKQELTGLRIEILGKHLRKTVIRYSLEFRDSSTASYVGLHRESDKRLQTTFSVLRLLGANGFNHDSDLRVPKPVLNLPGLSFLLMEEAEGKTLRSILTERAGDCERRVSGAARWLAMLHQSGIKLDRELDRAEGIARSLKYREAATRVLPGLESKIRHVGRALIRSQEKMPHSETTAIHGDYHPKNVIVSPNTTTVIDFEEARMGDPAFDVGYFIAQAKMTHGFEQSIDRATQAFLAEYLNKTSFHHSFEHRARIWEAQTYFQRIYHSYNLLGLSPDYGRISEWLTESEMCLAEAA